MEQRLIRLEETKRAAALLEGWQETLIWSALEGDMGCIWTVSHAPKAALCENGNFLFLAGAAAEAETRLLLECWHQEKRELKILVPRDAACGSLIEAIYGAAARREERYAFCKGGESFARTALQKLVRAVPEAIVIVPFDHALYHQALQNEWSRDFCSQFGNAEDYLARGIGFAALHSGEMIGGASSYIRYSKGIEVQVETRSDWQRRGIASACCAALILECLNRGLYPSWDAANPASAALAQKLGYREAGAYPVWEIPKSSN